MDSNKIISHQPRTNKKEPVLFLIDWFVVVDGCQQENQLSTNMVRSTTYKPTITNSQPGHPSNYLTSLFLTQQMSFKMHVHNIAP